MAFNLKKVLKALLYSSSQPLAIKDIQGVFERYHLQSVPLPAPDAPAGDPPGADVPDVPAEAADSPDLYEGVPSLVTAAQIREAMAEIALEVELVRAPSETERL